MQEVLSSETEDIPSHQDNEERDKISVEQDPASGVSVEEVPPSRKETEDSPGRSSDFATASAEKFCTYYVYRPSISSPPCQKGLCAIFSFKIFIINIIF